MKYEDLERHAQSELRENKTKRSLRVDEFVSKKVLLQSRLDQKRAQHRNQFCSPLGPLVMEQEIQTGRRTSVQER